MAEAPVSVTDDQRYRVTRRVTLLGGLVDGLLGVVKLLVGAIAHSQALVADGVHSLSDLATDGMVLYAAKHASKEPDEDHPYGHGRIETAATVALGVALIAVSVGIAYDAVRRLFAPELLLQPGPWALAVAGASVVAKEAIYHYTMHAARRFRSKMLRANAWHSRTDALSSIIVMVGVAGTMAGLDYLDAIAAVGVAAMIAKIGWDLGWPSIRDLVDTSLERDRVEAIRKAILEVDGVDDLHMLRTRQMGPDALVDVHVLVDPKLSVSEGHQIGERVRARLQQRIDEVVDVMVHVDPEDDARAQPCQGLPLRADMLARLQRCWSDLPGGDAIEDVRLHYLDGRVHADVILPVAVLEDGHDADELRRRFAEAARCLPETGEVDVYFH